MKKLLVCIAGLLTVLSLAGCVESFVVNGQDLIPPSQNNDE